MEQRLSDLEGKTSAALGLITDTIDCLDNTVAEYEAVKAELEETIQKANENHVLVSNKIARTKAVSDNFKNLLK